MRSDIIDEILSVEDRASQIVKEAQDEGRTKVLEAQTKAAQDVHDAVSKRRLEHQKELEQAEADSAVQLDNYQASLDVSSTLVPEAIDQIADKIVMMVSKTTLFGGQA
ncbi:MAG: hypothetical protein LKE39_07985 [Sphaerochaeta sp.]|jgi:F0F1-type ATP synthase membrane subunit b/b'|nr:hypothetical protein [Sphaerochaeta sp.]MCH3920386.1 hypothetical protein [Sphaerochaeta sp.]MCI2044968.1 hypothetical protein [Sphaerochaeta sp.]MCI2076307.1 hypothetical protein [Sphaerochaeta sp.]MCI2096533.1 hypothetical protein [Sphaerochaeta sp.]